MFVRLVETRHRSGAVTGAVIWAPVLWRFALFSLGCPSLLCCCVLGAEPTTGSTNSAGVKMPEEKTNFWRLCTARKKLPPKPKQKTQTPDGERASTSRAGVGRMNSRAACWWGWEEFSSPGGALGPARDLEECCFDARCSWVGKHFSLQSIGALKEVVSWLMDLGRSGQSNVRSRATFNPAVIPRGSRISAGKASGPRLPLGLVASRPSASLGGAEREAFCPVAQHQTR